MPIAYKIVEQCQPGIKGGGEKKYYARAWKRQKMSINSLCELIAERSTFSGADVKGVVAAFTEMIPELLKKGYTVDLEGLGIFSISIKSRAEKSYNDVTKRSITGSQINFRPSPRLKNEIKKAEFTRKLK